MPLTDLRPYLESTLGKRWRVVLTVFVALAFAPSLVFSRGIAFAPADFVEEWIKLAFGGFFLLLILESYKFRAVKVESRNTQARFVGATVADPLKALHDHLVEWRAIVSTGDEDQAASALARLDDAWTRCRHIDRIPGVLVDSEMAVALRTALYDLNIDRCDSLVRALTKVGGALEHDIAEVAELLERVSKAVEATKGGLFK